MASLPSMGPAWMPLVRSVNAKARFLGSLYASVNQISMFTTTSPFLAAGPKKSSVRTGVQKGQRNTVVRKNRTIQKPTGRRIEPGERKAFRKRVVLSNTNALEVEGLQELTAESLQNADEVRGKMMALPGSIVDSLRAVDAFKPTQCWHMYRKPAVMMTEEAVELAKTMTESVSKQKSTARRIIVGERMCGKTTFLLQAMSMAFLKGWVVVNLPDANDITNSLTDYAPLEDSSPIQYFQKTYTAKLLSQIRTANQNVLSKLKTTKPLTDLPVGKSETLSLDKLAELGSQSPDFAWPIFTALWTELTQPSQERAPRPPILFACDNIQRIMRESEYLDASENLIHAYDLSIVANFMACITGVTTLPNGGVVLGAATESNVASSPAFRFAVECAEARAAGEPAPEWNPYKWIDTRVTEALKDVEVTRLKGLSKDNTTALLEYFAASGVLTKTVDESLVSEKWTLSGGGNIGELERATVRMFR